jgi:hypothetical protein
MNEFVSFGIVYGLSPPLALGKLWLIWHSWLIGILAVKWQSGRNFQRYSIRIVGMQQADIYLVFLWDCGCSGKPTFFVALMYVRVFANLLKQ